MEEKSAHIFIIKLTALQFIRCGDFPAASHLASAAAAGLDWTGLQGLKSEFNKDAVSSGSGTLSICRLVTAIKLSDVQREWEAGVRYKHNVGSGVNEWIYLRITQGCR